MAENFNLIFGSQAPTTASWSDADYQTGWNVVGSTPPTAEQFDALQNRSDKKSQELNNRLSPLEQKAQEQGRQAGTAYKVGAAVTVDGLPADWLLVCTTAGTSGTAAITLPNPLIDGATITDGTITWKLRKVATNGGLGYRQPSTAYAVGNIAYHASLPTGYCLECTTGGTTSSGDLMISSPSIGGTVSDGTVTWKVVKYALTTDAPPLASALATPRKIELTGKAKGSTSFDGSTNASINVTSVNADTASKLSAARKINITGNATGAAEFDGSGNISINTTVNESKHAASADIAATLQTTDGSGTVENGKFYWISKDGQPMWLWGSNTKPSETYVYNPSKFHVAAANNDGNGANIANTYLKKSGGNMNGPLNFANGAWNLVGDDSYMGDHNISGTFCIKGANGETGIALVNVNNEGDRARISYGGGTINFDKTIGGNLAGTADNATKWNGIINDLATENNVDTWIPVLKDNKLQHTTKAEMTVGNADKVDGYHYSDIVTKIQGKTTPTMTALVDWAAMTTACNLSPATVSVSTVVDGSSVTLSVPSIKNLRNIDTGIMAYGGDNDSGSLTGTNRPFYKGDIILKQSYKNFDKILIIFCNDDSNLICYKIWEKWELEYAFDHSWRFVLFEVTGRHWWLYGTKKQGTNTQHLSTDTFWRDQDQSSGIIEIYGLKY